MIGKEKETMNALLVIYAIVGLYPAYHGVRALMIAFEDLTGDQTSAKSGVDVPHCLVVAVGGFVLASGLIIPGVGRYFGWW
jgi:hypothetical protein